MPGLWKTGFRRKEQRSCHIQDGLWQIGNQACHILVHTTNNNKDAQVLPPGDNTEQLLVLIPRASARRALANSGKFRLSPVIEDARISHADRLDVVPDDTDLDLWDSRFMLRGDHEPDNSYKNSRWGPRGWFKPSCIPISIILILIVLVVLLPLLDQQERQAEQLRRLREAQCGNNCRFSYVESIPEGMVYPKGSPAYPSTYQTWLDLINTAENSIEIASMYWTLRKSEVYPDPSSEQGEDIFQALLKAGLERNVTIRIAQNIPSHLSPNTDTEYLSKIGAAEVRSLNFTRLIGAGILHTKLWLIDRKHFYVGSANMDWRSLTQVKEMGAVIHNCSCIAADMGKIFDVYWFLGKNDAEIPGMWPEIWDTEFNMNNPLNVSFNGTDMEIFAASSPPSFCPTGRSTDIATILNVISTAKEFIYIAVMDYFPLLIYTKPIKVWQVIDDALRVAAIEKNVEIRLLVSHWKQTRSSMLYFLRSLSSISGSYKNVSLQVKLFEVPSTPAQAQIPFARVNHNKYMVTDTTAYIGTSNWSGDYFVNTAGIGLVVREPQKNSSHAENIRAELQTVFERDWNSPYALPLSILK